MKTLILALLLGTISAASANDQLAEALWQNSATIEVLKNKCGDQLNQVETKNVSDGIYAHTFTVSKFEAMRGATPKCRITITQDYTPTYADGAVAYTIDIKHL